jgi:hypothetical protein
LDINFIHDTLLLKIEKISERTENIMVQYFVMRIMDMILKHRLITFENKETGSLIYFINNIFLLHDILIGSAIAKRMVLRAKPLLHYVLKRSKNDDSKTRIEDINEDQEEEIKELLSLPNLKGSEIYNDVTTLS